MKICIDVPQHHRPMVRDWVREDFSGADLIEEGTLRDDDPFDDQYFQLFKFSRQVIDEVCAERGVSARIYLAIATTLELNAFAATLGGDEYCIILTMGCIYEVPRALQAILSVSAFDELFGFSTPGLSGHAETGLNALDGFRQICAPGRSPTLDEQREDVRRRASVRALEWLVLHELAHIINGHLAPELRKAGRSRITEIQPHRSSADENITSHTLEMDADCFAFNVTMRRSITQHRPLSFQGDNPLDLRVVCLLLAVSVTMRCFEHRIYQPEDLWSESHPPAMVRMFSALALMETHHTYQTGALGSGYYRVFEFMENAISQSAGSVAGSGNLVVAMQWLHDGTYVETLNSRWARLHPALTASKLHNQDLQPPQAAPR